VTHELPESSGWLDLPGLVACGSMLTITLITKVPKTSS